MRHAGGCTLKGRNGTCKCGPVYRARISRGERGQQVSSTRSFDSLREAQDWLDQMHGALEGIVITGNRDDSLGAAWARWLADAEAGEISYRTTTVENYTSVMNQHVLTSKVGNVPLADLPIARFLGPRVLQDYIDRLAKRTTPHVATLAAKAIRAVMRNQYRPEVGGLDQLPPDIIWPKAPRNSSKRENSIYSRDQVDAMLAAAEARGPYAHALIEVLGFTGVRIDELIHLRWDDIRDGEIDVTVSKTDAGIRTIAVDDKTAAALDALREISTSEFVFPNGSGGQATRSGKPRYELNVVAEAAGVSPVGFHRFRHTHLSRLAREGANEAALAERAGHTSASFTRDRYIKPIEEERARLAGMVAATR